MKTTKFQTPHEAAKTNDTKASAAPTSKFKVASRKEEKPDDGKKTFRYFAKV